MIKKMSLAVSVLLLIGVFFFFVFYSGPPGEEKTLERGALAGEVRQAEKLLNSLGEGLSPEEIHLCFKGEELACDRGQSVWYLPVDMDQEEWEAGTFSDVSEEIRILPLLDYTLLDKQEAVAEGREIPFLAWSEKQSSCAVIQVVFTGLSVIRMETDADLDVDTVFAGSLMFYESCGKEDWTTSSAFQAHERGQTTRAYPKKGYRVELIDVTQTGVINKNRESVLGMRTSDSWIFYAIYSDGTKVRDKFNTELWNQFGAKNTPYDAHYGTHMEYAELIVNGEYRGLYGIMEPVDSRQLQISDQDYLYKRTYGRELLGELFDQASPEEYLTVLGMELKGRNGAGTKADWACFREFVTMCEEEDTLFSREAEALLDMDNLADMWIYLQLLYGEDNIYKNMFFVFRKESDGYRLYLVPWDTDLTWGNIYSEKKEDLYTIYAPERADQYLEWPLADRLIRLDTGGIRKKIQERWDELRQTVFSETEMEHLLSDCIHWVQDSGAFARDAVRWPESHHDGDYESLRSFMRERLEFMDDLIQSFG